MRVRSSSSVLPIPSLFPARVFLPRGTFRIALLCACLFAAFAMPPEARAQQNEWTWVSGSSLPNGPGMYGTLGTPAAGNVPGWRNGAASWTDSSGNLWLFGGVGLSANFAGNLNDLWEFNPSTSEWAWMGGSDTTNQPGVYGTLGKSAAANIPGARTQASSWTDNSGNFWLFGGNGYDESGHEGLLNDLWVFHPATKQWTWVAGSQFYGELGIYGTLGTPAALNTPGGRYEAASWADDSGHFWIFGGDGVNAPEGVLNDLWEFSPASGEWTWMGGNSTVPSQGWVPGVYGTLGTPAAGNMPGSRSSAVTWTDNNGNLWLFGGLGYGISTSIYQGFLNDFWEYNPSTNEWAWMGGSSALPGPDQTQPGVYGTLGTPAAGNVPGGRSDAVSWIDTSGNLWLFGGVYNSGPNNLYDNDLWVYLPAKNEWAWMSGSDQPSLLGYEVYGTLGVYGMLGVPAAANMPGSRQLASSWVDKSGNFWLFGGDYLNSIGLITYLNDLWGYQPAAPGGGGSPLASLAPSPLAFPSEDVKTTSATASVTLTNTGTAALTGIVISLTGTNPSDFAIMPAANACGTSLPAGSSCFIYVNFTPAAATNYAATLSVSDNATGSPQTATLTGTGITPPPVALDIAEVIHTTDTPVLTPSTLLNIAEIITTTDTPVLRPSVLLNIAEVIRTTDAVAEKTTAAPQTITFGALPNLTYGAAPFALTAMASSGLPVRYTVTGLATVSGSTLTITGAGQVTVTASQAGNANFAPATPVSRSFTVAKAVLSATAVSLSRKYDVVDPSLTYAVTGFVNGESSSVVSGSATLTTTATLLSLPGNYPITFVNEGLIATNYSFAYVPGTLTVASGPLRIAPSSGNFGSITVGKTSPVISFSVTNDTASTMGFLGYTNLGEFYLQPGTCHLVNGEPMLKPGQSCVFTAAFHPTRVGPASGNLSIQTSSGNFNVPMTGTGATE